jgi:hypothetical protein
VNRINLSKPVNYPPHLALFDPEKYMPNAVLKAEYERRMTQGSPYSTSLPNTYQLPSMPEPKPISMSPLMPEPKPISMSPLIPESKPISTSLIPEPNTSHIGWSMHYLNQMRSSINQQYASSPKPPVDEPIRAVDESGSPLRTLYLPRDIIQEFLKIAHINTEKQLETCGILCGYLVSKG